MLGVGGERWPVGSGPTTIRPAPDLDDVDVPANDVAAAAVWRRLATEGGVVLELPTSACAAATAR